ncbi:hypothetical protein BJ165DRAFT_1531879 [Panaeolus papilionaceus]|nr:hypothetical protein BJ165DRAFT_1531879 [Panaeolus papilionaceus]
MVPTIAFFPPARTVRFSPSHVSSVIEEDEDKTKSQISATSLSVLATTELATTTAITPSQISTTVPLVDVVAEPPQQVRRHIPGYFLNNITETEYSISSPPPRASRCISSNGHTRLSVTVFPTDAPFTDDEEEHDDLNKANVSSTPPLTISLKFKTKSHPLMNLACGNEGWRDDTQGPSTSFLTSSFRFSSSLDTQIWERHTASLASAGASGSGAGSGNPPPPLGLGLGAPGLGHSNSNSDANPDADVQSHHTRSISAFLPQIPDLENDS